MLQGKNAGTNKKVGDFPFNQSIEIHGIKQAGTIAIYVLRLLPPTSAGFDRICDIPIYPKKNMPILLFGDFLHPKSFQAGLTNPFHFRLLDHLTHVAYNIAPPAISW